MLRSIIPLNSEPGSRRGVPVAISDSEVVTPTSEIIPER